MRSCLLVVLAFWGGLPVMGDDKVPETVDYRRDVKPILAAHCYSCHGLEEQESGLRLDAGKLVLRGGDRGPAIVPKASGKSLMMLAITGQGKLEAMPPGEKLSAREIAVIRRWIDQGGAIPANEKVAALRIESDHWSFQRIRRPALPQVRNREWSRNPIDRFVLARLEAAGLSPSGPADRVTLIRRLSLDLLGLPPSLEEVDAFLADRGPDAYARLVNRLLASPRYGERWGRHWLDLARYADSNGFTIDGARTIWPYRDWVIGALNKDLPFNDFATQQLAGDLLKNPLPDQVVATGFHRNTLVNEEGGTNDEEFRVESVVDRVNTTGSVFLGLTIGCAQCHKHKFDPITQRDFYRMFAIFNHTEDANDARHASGPLGPLLSMPTPSQKARIEALKQTVQVTSKQLRAHDAKLSQEQRQWESKTAAFVNIPWSDPELASVKSLNGARMQRLPDRSILVGGKIPETDVYELTLRPAPKSASPITAIRLQALTHKSLPKNGPGLTRHGNFTLSEFEVYAAQPVGEVLSDGSKTTRQTWKRLPIARAFASRSQEKGDIANAIDGKLATFWGIYGPAKLMNADHDATFVLKQPVRNSSELRIVMRQQYEAPRYAIGRFRLTVTTAAAEILTLPAEVRRFVSIPVAKRSKQQQETITAAFRASDTTRRPLAQKLADAQARLKQVRKSVVTTMVMRERPTPRKTHIHIRGDFLRKGALVSAGVPAVLPPLKPSTSGRPTRLDFGNWLFDRRNPLTARVTVNRHWQRLFGRGLVETENDFGTQGSEPTHPGLLDWLASELPRRGWSIKQLHRLIVTSATYRQSSRYRPELAERDPTNRWLARQARLRLPAESIRDVSLAAAGVLSSKMGGPGVYPPQPKGIYVLTQNKKGWDKLEDRGEDRYRRGLYTYFWRSSPYPFLPTFDAPDANTACTRRPRSNTPLQALTLANDEAFMEFARRFAARILRGKQETDDRLEYGFRICLSRRPGEYERKHLRAYVQRQLQHYADHTSEAKLIAAGVAGDGRSLAEAAAWTSLARVLMNLDEFITRD